MCCRNNRQGLSAAAGVRTPYDGYRVLDAAFSHKGDADNFENTLDLQVNDEK